MAEQQDGVVSGMILGIILLEERGRTFWRFAIEIGMGDHEQKVE